MFDWSAWPIVILIVVLIGLGAWFQLRSKKEIWTVVTARDINDVYSRHDYKSFTNEHAACETGRRLFPSAFIRRPDGTMYQISFRPESHVTDDKIHAAMNATEPTEYEKLVSEMEHHVRDCGSCCAKYFQKVQAVRLMRSRSLPLLNLSASARQRTN